MCNSEPKPQLAARLPKRKGNACFGNPEYMALVAAIEYNQNFDTIEVVNTGSATIASGCIVAPDYGSAFSVKTATTADTSTIIGHALQDIGVNAKGSIAVYGTLGVVKAGGTISAGDFLTNNSNGAAVSTGSNVTGGTFATALQNATAGDSVCAILFGTQKEAVVTFGENVGSLNIAATADEYAVVYEGCGAANLLSVGDQMRVQSTWTAGGIDLEDCAGFAKRIVELETVAAKNCEHIETLDNGVKDTFTALDIALTTLTGTGTAQCGDDKCPADISVESEWGAGTIAHELQTEPCCYEAPETDEDTLNEHFLNVLIGGTAFLTDYRIETFGMCPDPNANVEVILTDMGGKASATVLVNGQIAKCVACMELNLANGTCVQLNARTTNGGDINRCFGSTTKR